MELTYVNANGKNITLTQSRPYFLQKINGTGDIRQTVNTFKAPDQDGAFYISSTLDMRNITLEGTVIADSPDEAYARRHGFLQIFSPKVGGTLLYREAANRLRRGGSGIYGFLAPSDTRLFCQPALPVAFL